MEVIKIEGKNIDGVPGHWEDIHIRKKHPGKFSDGCKICLNLFENKNRNIIPAVISVKPKKRS